MSKLNDQTIQFVSALLEIKCHHYDLFDEPPYKLFNDELKDAICLIYSSQTGPWRMAINQDGTIVMPTDLTSPRKIAEEFLQDHLSKPEVKPCQLPEGEGLFPDTLDLPEMDK
jgi:hypothetical protein